MNEREGPCTPVEQMIVSAARLINDYDVIMAGTQWPVIVSLLAKSLHAPNISIGYEGGIVIDQIPDRIPLFTGDPVVNTCASSLGSSLETLGMILHGRRCDMGILSAASVDRYGNINTTCIGDYTSPIMRFGGSGGACDFGSLAPKVVIVLEHGKRRFPEKVDFITTPGYLQGRESRRASGLRKDTGPFAVVTTMGLFQFDGDGEMVLKEYISSASVQEVSENVQWKLKIDDDVKPLKPPTDRELDVLRNRLDPQGMYIRYARFLEGKEISV